MADLFDKHGGFRKLHSFTLATIILFETLRFCRRFLTFDHRQAGENSTTRKAASTTR
jgi:restriction system protein